jgi:hypothetical protein
MEARRATGTQDGRLDLRRACDAATVQVLRQKLIVGNRRHTAMLVPSTNGFRVIIDPYVWQQSPNSDRTRQRVRYLVAHELGHTLFYQPGTPPKRAFPADADEERFCHRFAMSFLVPPSALEQTPLEGPTLFELTDRFDVTLRTAATSLALAHRDLTILWLVPGPHPHRGGELALRVQWGASNRYIAAGESFKSTLVELAPGEEATIHERLLLSGRTEEVTIRAWRYTNAMLAFVQASIPLSSPPASAKHREQLQLF